MSFDAWFLVVGTLLGAMALVAPLVRRLPLSTSMLYLAVGLLVGPAGLRLLQSTPLAHAVAVERLAEVAVLVSLFASGVKTSGALRSDPWSQPVRLATVSMLLTIALIALLAHALFGMNGGAAILLGAILAPTDPVLASDVQVDDAGDRDRLRFALTGEAGLNDGSAFPFVMLGLGLLGLHDLGDAGLRWLALDVAWASLGGLAIGAAVGAGLTMLLLRLERDPGAAGSPAEHFAIGCIALAYGLALAADTYGFLAVFAAGFAHRRIALAWSERGTAGCDAPPSPAAARQLSVDVLRFTEQLERIGEVAVVMVVGAWLGALSDWSWDGARVAFLVLLFLGVRPLAVHAALLGVAETAARRWLMSWFGIRGIGSIYYLTHAINAGLSTPLATTLTTITLEVVAASIVLHGLSVTPLMQRYRGRVEARRRGVD